MAIGIEEIQRVLLYNWGVMSCHITSSSKPASHSELTTFADISSSNARLSLLQHLESPHGTIKEIQYYSLESKIHATACENPTCRSYLRIECPTCCCPGQVTGPSKERQSMSWRTASRTEMTWEESLAPSSEVGPAHPGTILQRREPLWFGKTEPSPGIWSTGTLILGYWRWARAKKGASSKKEYVEKTQIHHEPQGMLVMTQWNLMEIITNVPVDTQRALRVLSRIVTPSS